MTTEHVSALWRARGKCIRRGHKWATGWEAYDSPVWFCRRWFCKAWMWSPGLAGMFGDKRGRVHYERL
jgi:hypothetical protein